MLIEAGHVRWIPERIFKTGFGTQSSPPGWRFGFSKRRVGPSDARPLEVNLHVVASSTSVDRSRATGALTTTDECMADQSAHAGAAPFMARFFLKKIPVLYCTIRELGMVKKKRSRFGDCSAARPQVDPMMQRYSCRPAGFV